MANEKKIRFAVIETGGKQYLVKPGDKIRIEKIEKPADSSVIYFDKVLLIAAEAEIKLGNPYIKDAKIAGEWMKEGKGKKITHLRYHSKTRYTKKSGHRQIFNEIQIGEF